MMKLYTVPHGVLRKKAKPVDEVTPEIQGILDEMLEFMYVEGGGGLAAPQVGLSLRMVVIDPNAGDPELPPDPHFLVNPTLTWTPETKILKKEACLSVPGVVAEVYRFPEVEVSYLDRKCVLQKKKEGGYFGHCVQHELDHLDGIIHLDHMSLVKRKLLLARSVKIQQQEA